MGFFLPVDMLVVMAVEACDWCCAGVMAGCGYRNAFIGEEVPITELDAEVE